jgi:hypothetical protein
MEQQRPIFETTSPRSAIQKLAKYGMTPPYMLYKTCTKKTNSAMLYLFFPRKALVLKQANSGKRYYYSIV